MSIAPSGVTSSTFVPFGSLSRFVTLSVKSTFPPFSISSFLTSGSYLSESGVSFVTVTTTFLVIVSSVGFPSAPGFPVPFDVIVTGIVTFLLVSPSPNVTSGFPTRLPSLSTLNPFVGVDVIVVFGLFGVTTFVLSATFSPFLTDGFLTSASRASYTFLFLSWLSGMPSLSSSGSVVSGMPSPSVSLSTCTFTGVFEVFPDLSVATTFAPSKVVSSWLSSHLTWFFGIVPSICFLSLLYVRPFGRPCTSTFASASSTCTGTDLIGWPSVASTNRLPSSSTFVTFGAVVSFSATLIGAFTSSFVPSEYFTITGIFTVFPASPSTGV